MGPGQGPINEYEGFFVSADFNCFRKGVWAWEGAHPSLFLLISNVLGKGCGAGEGAHY